MNGISNLSIIPVRSDPSERAEMVTQILFGECFDILDEKDGWLLISCQNDSYEGWIDKKMAMLVSPDFVNSLLMQPYFQVSDFSAIAQNNLDNSIVHLLKGSLLPLFNKGTFHLDHLSFSFKGNCVELPKMPLISQLEKEALSYLNVPYLWGGRSPYGIDCSGFVQMVCRSCGINIPRDASQQVTRGETVNFIFESKPGDLAFFDNASGSITHVGIILSNSKIIHASGKVRIDSIDHNGIFDSIAGKYSHNLRIIRRIFN